MAPILFTLQISCILILSLNPFPLSHANTSTKPNTQTASPLSFLNNIIGAQKGRTAKGLSELKKHLSYIGYMKMSNNSNTNKTNDDLFDDNLELAIKKYQAFFHLQITGILDAKTVQNMQLPRCGVADFVNLNLSQFLNHNITIVNSHYTFFPGNPKWPPQKTTLTYSFPKGTRKDVMQPIKDATQEWANVTHFKFNYIEDYNRADIKISFQVKDHGDGVPFDGPSGILAHAFAPSDGRLHYDGDERWVDGVAAGEFDLQTIGVHELGHVLGLGHSTDSGSVMYPTIGPGLRKRLGKDDIDGIRALYKI